MERMTHFGVTLDLDPEVISPFMITQLRTGRYETVEARNLPKLIEQDDIVLEIGAGIGLISSLIAADPRVQRCVSYEANPALMDILKRHVTRHLGGKLIKKWEGRNAVLAVGAEQTEVDFYVHPNFWASSLLKIPAPLRVDRVAVQEFNALRAALRPTLIVCDIEGGELELLCAADLTGVTRVYVEVHQRRIGGGGMRDLFNAMHRHGFHYDEFLSNGSVILFRRIV